VAADSKAQHVKRLVLHETGGHGLGGNTFVGTDKARSRATNEVVGFDTFTGHFSRATNKVVIHVALALKGGIIVGRVTFDGSQPRFDGRILKGTGKFQGVNGTITGRSTNGKKTFVTLRYIV